MKKLLIFTLLAFQCLGAFGKEKPTLAIMLDVNININGEQASLYPFVAELSSALGEEYKLVERMEEFQAIINQEKQYQASGHVADERIKELGNEFEADQVCAVLVKYLPESDEYQYFVKLISVENLDVKKTAQAYKSNLSRKYQQDAAKEIFEQLFPSSPIISSNDLLYCDVYKGRYDGGSINASVYTNDGRYVDIKDELKKCNNYKVMRLYNSYVSLDRRYDNLKYKTYMWIGAGLEMAGFVFFFPGIITETPPFTIMGASFMTIGAIVNMSALIYKWAPTLKLKKAIRIYNKEIKNSPYFDSTLSIGPTPSGIGLCLKF